MNDERCWHVRERSPSLRKKLTEMGLDALFKALNYGVQGLAILRKVQGLKPKEGNPEGPKIETSSEFL